MSPRDNDPDPGADHDWSADHMADLGGPCQWVEPCGAVSVTFRPHPQLGWMAVCNDHVDAPVPRHWRAPDPSARHQLGRPAW